MIFRKGILVSAVFFLILGNAPLYADDDAIDIPRQTILDIMLHLAVANNDIENTKKLIEMGADANSRMFWGGPTFYYQDEIIYISEIWNKTFFEKLRQLGIPMPPLYRHPFLDCFVDNDFAKRDALSVEHITVGDRHYLTKSVGYTPLRCAFHNTNFAMIKLLYPITSKGRIVFYGFGWWESEEGHLLKVLAHRVRERTPFLPSWEIMMGMEIYHIANFLIQDMLNRGVEIQSQTLENLKVDSTLCGRNIIRIDSILSRISFRDIIKDGIEGIGSTLWHEHPLVNGSFQYGQYAKKFFQRLDKEAREVDDKLNELRSFEQERAFLMAFKNLIDEAIQKFSERESNK